MVHSTKYVLFRLPQSLQRELDESEIVGTIILDLPKAYECIPRKLFTTKYKKYGSHKNSLNQLAN